MTKTKILFLLPALNYGGAERVLITFMNGLNTDLYERHFLVVNDTKQLKPMIDPAIPFHALGKKHIVPALPALHRAIKTIAPDLVVSTMAHMNFGLLALRPFFPDTKFIVREAITPSFLFQKYKPWDFLIKILYKSLYPKADTILSPAEAIFDEFKNDLHLDHKKFIVLNNPVDTNVIRDESATFHITEEQQKTVRFVTCGRLGKQKGYDRLIKTLGQTPLPFDWHLDMAGEGEERAHLAALIQQYTLQNNITLHGLIKRPYNLIAAADYFLLPSRFEGLPNVVLESLTCGTPVIATRESGGIAEIASKTSPKNLTVVDNIDAFLEKMKTATPGSKQKFSASCLPDAYKKQNTMREFEAILKKTLS